MKKIFLLGLIVLFPLFLTNYVKASSNASFDAFEEIKPINRKVKMLKHMSDSEIEAGYKNVSKKGFFRTRLFYFNRAKDVNFTHKTVRKIINTGETPIIQNVETKEEKMKKFAISMGSNIGSSESATSKGFKFGLDGKLNINAKAEIQISSSETISTKVQVEENSQLIISVKGHGRLYNGVFSIYRFWIKFREGAFEYMTISSLYYSIEKVKI